MPMLSFKSTCPPKKKSANTREWVQLYQRKTFFGKRMEIYGKFRNAESKDYGELTKEIERNLGKMEIDDYDEGDGILMDELICYRWTYLHRRNGRDA